MTTPSPTDATSPSDDGARSAHAVGRQAARSGAVGSMLEFFDFFIYTQAAALVFPTVFFPSDDPALAIIASLGTFGVGYLARPVDAFVLGAMADRRGRRASVTLQGAQLGQIIAAMIFIPLAALLPSAAFDSWGWRIPFLVSAAVTLLGLRTRLATVESKSTTHEEIPPIRRVLTKTPGTVTRVMIMSLANIVPVTTTVLGASLATQKAYGIGWHADVFLWIPVLGNLAAVLIIPAAAAASDAIGRRPMLIGGALSSGLLSFAYLWAISKESMVLAIVLALVMWGTLYQRYNAVFPSFFPEQFPASTRVTGMAIGQNLGTALSSLMAMVFAWLCPPGTSFGVIVAVVGGLTFGLTCLVAVAA